MRDVAGIPGSCLASRGAASEEGDKKKQNIGEMLQ